VKTRIRLVHTASINYLESGDSVEDLFCLSAPDSSTCSGQENVNATTGVHALRETYGADLVQLWVETNEDVCGIGWRPPSLTMMSSNYAFSVKIRSCGSGTTIHEMGHNLSLQHDRYQSRASMSDTAAGYSYGYVITDLKVRDIMSYDAECTDSGFNCARIGYFSNPRLLYQGVPLGINKIADSARTINAARVYVANYLNALTPYDPDVLSGCQEALAQEASANPCFIATAAYGHPFKREVSILRNFRDQTLSQYPLGNSFINLYNQYSPFYARMIEKNEILKWIVRSILTPLVFMIEFPVFASIFFIAVFSTTIHLIAKTKRKQTW
jgi:hypothetical protein